MKLCKLVLPLMLLAPMPLDIGEAHAGAFVKGSTLCLPNYVKWKKRTGWKAFALSIVTAKGQECGWSYDTPSKRIAISVAMSQCRKYQRKRPLLGKPNSCYIYDVRQR
jgi:hypothetical protein